MSPPPHETNAPTQERSRTPWLVPVLALGLLAVAAPPVQAVGPLVLGFGEATPVGFLYPTDGLTWTIGSFTCEIGPGEGVAEIDLATGAGRLHFQFLCPVPHTHDVAFAAGQCTGESDGVIQCGTPPSPCNVPRGHGKKSGFSCPLWAEYLIWYADGSFESLHARGSMDRI